MWRSNNGTGWDQVDTDGFGDYRNHDIQATAVFSDCIYTGLSTLSLGRKYGAAPTARTGPR